MVLEYQQLTKSSCTHGCSFLEPDVGRPGQDMGVTRHYPRPQQDRIIDELSTSLKDHGE